MTQMQDSHSQPPKTGILLVAYGSASHPGALALRGVTEKARAAFSGIPVRWAFTSALMRTRLAEGGKKTDSVKKALCRMGFEHYTHVAVQSLHLIAGKEYEVLLEEIALAAPQGGPGIVTVGQPLLHTAEDVHKAANALLAHLPEERTPDEAVLCVGHGTWHMGAAGYEALSRAVAAKDNRVYIGTLQGKHDLTHALSLLKESGAKTVWLLPLLSVVGKHAESDMAGTHRESWRGRIEEAGFTCRPILKGTAEYSGFVDIWLSHLGEAMAELPKN